MPPGETAFRADLAVSQESIKLIMIIKIEGGIFLLTDPVDILHIP
jgi:hypothetical protein